ncbi:hypothetical protein P152DRAFT_326344 [Eremomyces bilateralis CBS 781.70]|uniref:DUF7730 domain-containing protein n=1 Tax=Eremomyces bilateralis CBS 781.70 TaxID=1392243 RepID=A0A6G1G451_9PEZI|nr:uncharacterized protein P152DRAFT_326344 [Eremomyces bilateralis CBS 781.70]KAF1812798.1 hypothetical protein P152DRAFT_326344 [Eremomyces bilateralis CBS 781.70]
MDHLRRWREERRARKEPQPKYWRHSMVFPVLPSYDSRVPVRAAQPIGDEAVPCQSFLKLPSEIRNAIYKEVFGGRVIHLYLGHGKRQGTWEPRGQICRRKWEVLRDTRYEPTREIPFQEPFAYDMCLGKDWGPDLEKFGVLGLLLACRQTYHESLPFLFSENTFYLEMGAAPALLHNFKSILPESHLVRVTSLELTCYFKCFTAAKPWDGHRYCVDLPNRLIDTFPNLKSLKLIDLSLITRPCARFPAGSSLVVGNFSPLNIAWEMVENWSRRIRGLAVRSRFGVPWILIRVLATGSHMSIRLPRMQRALVANPIDFLHFQKYHAQRRVSCIFVDHY